VEVVARAGLRLRVRRVTSAGADMVETVSMGVDL